VYERFTKRARHVIVTAQDESRHLKHNYIGTEHLLLGLLREEHGLAARVLESLDITLEAVRAQVLSLVGEGDRVTTGQIPFTPRAKRVLELALREALALGHDYIGTEHLLLGIARENQGVAARILLDFSADASLIRSEILAMLSGPGRKAGQTDVGPELQDDVVFRDREHALPTVTGFIPPLVLGWLLFGVALGIGALVGWAIWGP
jgi:ATP-dependent Clp protease ATP-binding subunit ClpC